MSQNQQVEQRKEIEAFKKAFRKKAPKPTTPAQKAVSKVYQGSKKLIKKGVTKSLPKFGKLSSIPAKRKQCQANA